MKFCQVGLDIRNEYKIMKRVKENNTFQLEEGGHVESANKESCSVSKPAGKQAGASGMPCTPGMPPSSTTSTQDFSVKKGA